MLFENLIFEFLKQFWARLRSPASPVSRRSFRRIMSTLGRKIISTSKVGRAVLFQIRIQISHDKYFSNRLSFEFFPTFTKKTSLSHAINSKNKKQSTIRSARESCLTLYYDTITSMRSRRHLSGTRLKTENFKF